MQSGAVVNGSVMSSADAGLPQDHASEDEVDHQPIAEGVDDPSGISADEQQLPTVKPPSLYPDLTDLTRPPLHQRKSGSSRPTGPPRGPQQWTTASADRLDLRAGSPPPSQMSSTGQQEATHEGKVHRPIKWHSMLIPVFFIVVLLLVLLYCFCLVKADSEICTSVRPVSALWPFVQLSVNGPEGRWSRFLDELTPVKQRHKDLPPEIWIVIESQMKILLNGSASAPEAPAIIVFLSTGDKEDVARELVKNFATAAVRAYDDESYVSLAGGSFLAGGVEARKKVQNTFHEHFVTNTQHVIVLEKFDLFPVETLPLFLNLMDHENAKYKDGVLIVTAHANKSFAEFKFHTEEMLGKFDEFVEDHFFQAWKRKGVQADTIRAVISRLSGSTIVLHVGQDD